MESGSSNFEPGWILLSPTFGNYGHFMIAEEREGNGWWVIDSNMVGSYRIGKHYLTDTYIDNNGFYGWQPVRGSNN